MGLLDNMKARLGPARDKVSDLAQRHGGSIEHGLDKAARMVDEKTKGKYSDKIHAGTGKAKEAVDRLAHRDGAAPGGTAGAPAETARGAAPGGSGTSEPATGGPGTGGPATGGPGTVPGGDAGRTAPPPQEPPQGPPPVS
ncbi:antitoxin [Streptomyces sp. NRRL S-340]|uniref:antitoxin n=1 Tax=Streptomyces sp. NRRL S-340 TaxID=1463901 RepID=UPI00056B2A8F|nr:antitoxin [Streptomyces sp. NRRL S-340]